MFDSPWLHSVEFQPSIGAPISLFSFNLPLVHADLSLDLQAPVTFCAGENWDNKSTVLEALVLSCALPMMGMQKTEVT